MKTVSLSFIGLAALIATPAYADDQSASQSDYDCANYGECGEASDAAAQNDGSVVVGQTRGMNIAGRLGKKVSESPSVRPTTPKAVAMRAKAEPVGVSSARQRVAAPASTVRVAASSAAATRLRLAQGITFQSGSSELTAHARHNVNMLASSLLRADKLEMRFRIEGHTDAAGEDVANQLLSERRATAVVNYLVSKGVDRSRLEIAGFGETQLLDGVAPVASSNRRVVAKPLN